MILTCLSTGTRSTNSISPTSRISSNLEDLGYNQTDHPTARSAQYCAPEVTIKMFGAELQTFLLLDLSSLRF